MNISTVKPGDLVRVDVNGWTFIAEVTEKRPRELAIEPIGSKATYRSATARQVVGHWRKSRRSK